MFNTPQWQIDLNGNIQRIQAQDTLQGLQNLQGRNPIVPSMNKPVLDVGSILNDFWDRNIKFPIDKFFQMNETNLIVFVLGMVVLILGILETKAL